MMADDQDLWCCNFRTESRITTSFSKMRNNPWPEVQASSPRARVAKPSMARVLITAAAILISSDSLSPLPGHTGTYLLK